MVKHSADPEDPDSEVSKAMGFGEFKSTKHCDHSESAVEAVFKTSRFRRKYRVFMNRGASNSTRRPTREA